jgi:hypothetical protein
MALGNRRVYYAVMPWFEIRTFTRGDPHLPHLRAATQDDVQLFKFDNVEAAMAEAFHREKMLGENGFVAVYDEKHEMIWPADGKHP